MLRGQADVPETASDRLLRAITESAVEYAIITLDTAGLITSWNIGAERLLGWSTGEALGQSGALFFTEEDRAAGAPASEIAQARATGKAADERWHARRDGSRFWASGEMMLLLAGDGSAEGFLKILRDRTAEREATERLQESERRFRAIADTMPQIVWSARPDGYHDYFNRRWYEFTGLTPEESLGEGWNPNLHPEDQERAWSVWRDALATGRPYEIEYRFRDSSGGYRWFIGRALPLRDGAGRVERWFGTCTDIEELKRTQEALHESEARLRLALEAARVAIWEHEGATDTIKASPELNRLLGFPPDQEVSTAEIRSRYAPGERERLRAIAAAAVARGDHFVQEELRCEWGDREVHWLLIRAEILYNPDGGPPNILGAALDITERKRAEVHLRLLNNELNHRVKNSLATVQALVAQTLRNSGSMAQAQDALNSRLGALAKAHNVLTAEFWEGANLSDIAEQGLGQTAGQSRLRSCGPQVRLSPRAALAVSMALHELWTNALKYGSLSSDAGEVELTWTVQDRAGQRVLALEWREHGGPPVSVPTRSGFGSRLIQRLAGEIGGEAEMRFEPGGLVCRMTGVL